MNHYLEKRAQVFVDKLTEIGNLRESFDAHVHNVNAAITEAHPIIIRATEHFYSLKDEVNAAKGDTVKLGNIIDRNKQNVDRIYDDLKYTIGALSKLETGFRAIIESFGFWEH